MPSHSKAQRQSLTLAAQATALHRDIDAYTVNVDYKPLFTVLAELAELHNPSSFRFFDRLVMFDNPQKKKYLEDAGDEAKYYEEEATISKFLRHETGKRLKVGVMSTWTSRPVGLDRKEWQLADMHWKTYLIWECNVEKSDFDKRPLTVLCARQKAALRACVAKFSKAPVRLSLPPRTVNKGTCVPSTLQYLQKLAVKGLKVDRVENKVVVVEGYKHLY
ncbi:hypothetical protein B0H13DRAFT_1889031 [Mycena leptocephala]|nr:hypothetical protein B0H13DRAFT_1889031 [Mycena leptocephala]